MLQKIFEAVKQKLEGEILKQHNIRVKTQMSQVEEGENEASLSLPCGRQKLTLGVEPFHGESHSENMLKFKLIIICALCK